MFFTPTHIHCPKCVTVYLDSINGMFTCEQCGFYSLTEPVDNSSLKDKILRLHELGRSQPQIRKVLNCSAGTVGYWCSPNQKEKSQERKKRFLDKHPKEKVIKSPIPVKRKAKRKRPPPIKEEKVFKNKPLDLTDKVMVKINDKTWVYRDRITCAK